MNARPLTSYAIICYLLLISCHASKQAQVQTGEMLIRPSDNRLQYEGRVLKTPEVSTLYWSGTTVRFRFYGTGVKALLEDYNGQNYFNIIVDHNNIRRIRIDSLKQYYSLADNLPEGEHTIELFKRTQIHKEYKRGYAKLYGFQLNVGSRLLSPPTVKKRKIEFYGNSITCGHAIEDTTGGDSGASTYENNYLSYAALTARHYDAQYSCIAKSGIGLMVSFGQLIMPEMYNRLNPFDSTSLWNFSTYQPDVVVVNILQNDAGIVNRPEYEQYKIRFGSKPPSKSFIISSYQHFISELRGHYPKAYIICALGSMNATQQGSVWPAYVDEAVANLKDKKIFTHFFPYKNSPGHPRVKDHQVMADSLIHFIDTNIKW
jgi:hypothetical protein